MAGGVHQDAILSSDTGHQEPHRGLPGLIGRINAIMFRLSSIALIVAAIVLTMGVIIGHVLGHALAWQDEVTIFLISGAIFQPVLGKLLAVQCDGVASASHCHPASLRISMLLILAVYLISWLIASFGIRESLKA